MLKVNKNYVQIKKPFKITEFPYNLLFVFGVNKKKIISKAS